MMMFVLAGVGLASCNDDDTYAERKEHERKAINSFLSNGTCVLGLDNNDTILSVKPITVISEEQFHAQDSTTNVAKNEYVLIKSAGVYMQIVSKGAGKKLANGETAKVITRFLEFNILGDSLMCLRLRSYRVSCRVSIVPLLFPTVGPFRSLISIWAVRHLRWPKFA